MIELSNVIAIRVILQQPSPVWKDFRIEDLKLYRTSEVRFSIEDLKLYRSSEVRFSIEDLKLRSKS